MMRAVGMVVAVTLAWAAAGCEEDGGTQPRYVAPVGGSAPVAGGSGGSGEPSCKYGEQCPCANGLTGKTQCTGNVQSCDCSCEAEAVVPKLEPTSFEACAGDPLGTWYLSDVDYSAEIYPRPNGEQCPVDIEQPEPPRMLVQLLEGGVADFFYRGLSGSRLVLQSCLGAFLSEPSYCTQFAGCSAKPCGVCSCDGEQPFSLFPYSPGWETAGGTLRLTGKGNAGDLSVPYDYCVNGDRLSLREQGGKAVLHLARVELAKTTPRPCAERSVDACYMSLNPKNPSHRPESEDDACHVGVCVGDNPACATAKLDTDCTIPGCTWDLTQCSGEPASSCLFGDYGVIPGCDIIPAVPAP